MDSASFDDFDESDQRNYEMQIPPLRENIPFRNISGGFLSLQKGAKSVLMHGCRYT